MLKEHALHTVIPRSQTVGGVSYSVVQFDIEILFSLLFDFDVQSKQNNIKT